MKKISILLSILVQNAIIIVIYLTFPKYGDIIIPIGLNSSDYPYSAWISNIFILISTPMIAILFISISSKNEEYLGIEFQNIKKLNKNLAIIILLVIFTISFYTLYFLNWDMSFFNNFRTFMFKNNNIVGFSFILAWLSAFCYTSIVFLYRIIKDNYERK